MGWAVESVGVASRRRMPLKVHVITMPRYHHSDCKRATRNRSAKPRRLLNSEGTMLASRQRCQGEGAHQDLINTQR